MYVMNCLINWQRKKEVYLICFMFFLSLALVCELNCPLHVMIVMTIVTPLCNLYSKLTALFFSFVPNTTLILLKYHSPHLRTVYPCCIKWYESLSDCSVFEVSISSLIWFFNVNCYLVFNAGLFLWFFKVVFIDLKMNLMPHVFLFLLFLIHTYLQSLSYPENSILTGKWKQICWFIMIDSN